MKAQEIFKTYDEYILNTYTRTPVVFAKGKGSKLTDVQGRQYLDFFPGWGVSGLGHCQQQVVSAIRDQVGKLIHVSNNYYHINQAKLAEAIVKAGFDAKVFFCNSGAEANEAAIKFARIFGKGRFEIITMENSFHGRTLACLAATGQDKYKQGFAPLPEGFKTVPFNNLQAVKESINEKTVAVMLELIQGEGGINVADKDYIRRLRKLCDEKNLLLIVDEVQTGIGRTGKMFCFQNYDIVPDVITLAKALGGGLPIGVTLVKKGIADVFKPGMHASTFGGSPIVSKASLGVFKAMQKGKLVKNARVMGEYLFNRLFELKEKYPVIKEIRGMGLMWGIELSKEGTSIVAECLKRGLLINCTHQNVLRLMPALNINKKEIDKAILILDSVLKTSG